MLSFWEKNNLTKADYIVVGGGLVGLTTAIRLREFRPTASVIVLERGLLPSGASSRNAGFACFGSLSELLNDWQAMGQDRALELVKTRWKGLLALERRLGATKLGLLRYGGYELLRSQETGYLDKIEEVNNWLFPLFRQNIFKDVSGQVGAFGFDKATIKGIILNPLEAQVDTGLMMESLATYARRLGVNIITGSKVAALNKHKSGYQLAVANPIGGDPVDFTCRAVAVCTNAFAKQLLPSLKLAPGRGQVLVTKPVANLPWRGTFHIEEGYYYFRNYGNRIILGGGRQLNFNGETTTELALNQRIQTHLDQKLENTLLPGQAVEIEHRWSGIMAFGDTKEPIVEKLDDNLAVGVRLGGMGVALGSQVGEQLAQLLLADGLKTNI